MAEIHLAALNRLFKQTEPALIDDGDGTHDSISYLNEAYCFGLGVDHG
jgi:hypothetical protein